MPIQQMFLGAGGAAPLGDLPVTSNLRWYHDAYFFSPTQWDDLSGNGYHRTTSGSTMGSSISQHDVLPGTNYMTKHRKYIQNDNVNHGVKWQGTGLWPGSTYTLMHICARQDNTEGRIVDGHGMNFLSGFHGSLEGVFYHNAWILNTNLDSRTNFLVSIDRRQKVRSKGLSHSGGGVDSGYVSGSGSSPTASAGIGIGSGTYTGDIDSSGGENCNWKCIMIACWSDEKSDSDCNTLMDWGYDALYG